MQLQLLRQKPCIASGIASSLFCDGARASRRATAREHGFSGIRLFGSRGDAGAHGLFGHIRELTLSELSGGSGTRGGIPPPAGFADFDALPASEHLSRWQQPVAQEGTVPFVWYALDGGDRVFCSVLRSKGSSGRGGARPQPAKVRPFASCMSVRFSFLDFVAFKLSLAREVFRYHVMEVETFYQEFDLSQDTSASLKLLK